MVPRERAGGRPLRSSWLARGCATTPAPALAAAPPWWFFADSGRVQQLSADEADYVRALTKHVVRALLLREAEEPVVTLDATAVWGDEARYTSWLAATHTGLAEGIRGYYGSRGLQLASSELEHIVRS